VKPTNSKLLLPLDRNAYWWLNRSKDNADFVFFDKGNWWIVRSDDRPKNQPKNQPLFQKKSEDIKSPVCRQWVVVLLSVVLGISFAFNLLSFLVMVL